MGRIAMRTFVDMRIIAMGNIVDMRTIAKMVMDIHIRGAVQTFFWVNLGFCPNEGGGGSRQSQLFIKIAQNLICLGTVHKCDETHST